ncbi:hypothetical protein FisN_26Hh007 [Fistulifera solaris]|uniref:Peroxidase n=1 Tax=Fistulifera solaris TaxID=1519565 RepID=A0A1Z5JXE3_FISSO|nr:hypothetical protein FisN_26Hh007 [Fistulifera solaris]|eukprot:GAX18717.1 hypothetical protein FisN_26Hh007 [Fistulifera solaris]
MLTSSLILLCFVCVLFRSCDALPVKQEDADLSKEEHCRLYCEEYSAICPQIDIQSRARRSEQAQLSQPLSLEKCVADCVNKAKFRFNGTPQDFMNRNTIQCRRNHLHMQLQEQNLATSDHCLHAMFAGKERCNSILPSTVYYYGLMRVGKLYFEDPYYEPKTTLLLSYGLGLYYEGAMRGRLQTRMPYFEVPRQGVTCPAAARKYRSADGTCNHVTMPRMGAVNTPLISTLEPSPPRTLPPVKDVAAILRRPENPSTVAPFNQIAVAWIQMMTHDWFQHDPTNPDSKMNRVTHWWDASQLYGSTLTQQRAVRVPNTGKLRLDKHQELNYTSTGIPITGFADNWWAGLHMMHTLFVREHNWLADQFELQYPGVYTANDKFQLTRLCLSALLAKIHTIEWTPTLLDNPVAALGLHTNWRGVDAILEYGTQFELQLAYRIVGGDQSVPHAGNGTTRETMYNTTFAMTEEFVAVYRMHPLLPDDMEIEGITLTLNDLSFVDARKLTKSVKTTQTLLQAFGTTPANTLSLQNYPRQLYGLEKPGMSQPINLAEIDLQRDRERNLPRYNDMRRQLLLKPYKRLEDLTDDETELNLLKSVYQDIDQVDLMVGCLVDKDRPYGFAFGIVPFHVFLVMASRRILNDRFFMEDFNAKVYTDFGYNYVQSGSLKQVMVRHFPELNDQIPDNPFMNWT